jgi:hypothetical protein
VSFEEWAICPESCCKQFKIYDLWVKGGGFTFERMRALLCHRVPSFDRRECPRITSRVRKFCTGGDVVNWNARERSVGDMSLPKHVLIIFAMSEAQRGEEDGSRRCESSEWAIGRSPCIFALGG